MLSTELWFKDCHVVLINTPGMSWGVQGGFTAGGERGCRGEGHQSSKSDQKHLLPLRVLWAIIGGCAHTSNWQGSFGLKRNKKQRAIKSQRGETGRLAATHRRTPLKHCGASTARGDFRTQWERRSEERRGAREGARHWFFPPRLKSQFIILRDTLYRPIAFSLFVILGTQKRSQR